MSRLTFRAMPNKPKPVDFVIHRAGNFELYEAKWTATPALSDASSIQYAAEKLGENKITSRTLISRTKNPYKLQADILTARPSDL